MNESEKIAQAKLQFIEEVQDLADTLGYTPDHYDWIIHTDKRWQPYFKSWTAFLREAGLTKARTSQSHITEAKLCKILRIIEDRADRTIEPVDWTIIVDDRSRPGVWDRFYKLVGRYSSYDPIELRELSLEYTDGFEYPINYDRDSTWLSFRYKAGLDYYTKEELLYLGIAKLNSLNISRKFFRQKLEETDIDEMLRDNGLRNAVAKGLPHFAIYDNFRTFRQFFNEICQMWLNEDYPTSQKTTQTIVNSLRTTGDLPREYAVPRVMDISEDESVEMLLFKLKDIGRLLTEKGIPIQITIKTDPIPVDQGHQQSD